MKLPFPRQAHGQLGLSTALNAAVALDALVGLDPVVGVRDEGPSDVDGVAATKYVVTTAPPTTCSSARATAPKVAQRPSTVWVDGQGRLVQVRSSEYDGGFPAAVLHRQPALAGFPTGPTVTTATLTFSAFGAPVHDRGATPEHPGADRVQYRQLLRRRIVRRVPALLTAYLGPTSALNPRWAARGPHPRHRPRRRRRA